MRRLHGLLLALVAVWAPVAALAAPGDLLVGNDQGILRVDPMTGDRTLVSGRPAREWDGVAIASDGTAYAVDRIADAVFARPVGGGRFELVSGSSRGTGPAIAEPKDLAIEMDGALLLVQGIGADAMLLRIDPATGDRRLVAGIARGSGFAFSVPVAVAVEVSGAILVADHGWLFDSVIYRVDPQTGDRAAVSGAPAGEF
jgi:outer membrane protein assembly factor BamB